MENNCEIISLTSITCAVLIVLPKVAICPGHYGPIRNELCSWEGSTASRRKCRLDCCTVLLVRKASVHSDGLFGRHLLHASPHLLAGSTQLRTAKEILPKIVTFVQFQRACMLKRVLGCGLQIV